MGKMELLKSGFTGKVGTIYGSKGNGKINAKAVPFSHTPHNEKQKKAFSAFGCLQRLAAFISKSNFFELLNIKQKNLLNINSVAKWLKPMVSDGLFSIEKIENVIERSDLYTITQADFEKEKQVFKIAFTRSQARAAEEKSKTVLFIADNTGTGYISEVTENEVFAKSIPTKAVEVQNGYAVIFEVYTKNKKTYFKGLATKVIQTV